MPMAFMWEGQPARALANTVLSWDSFSSLPSTLLFYVDVSLLISFSRLEGGGGALPYPSFNNVPHLYPEWPGHSQAPPQPILRAGTRVSVLQSQILVITPTEFSR